MFQMSGVIQLQIIARHGVIIECINVLWGMFLKNHIPRNGGYFKCLKLRGVYTLS